MAYLAQFYVLLATYGWYMDGFGIAPPVAGVEAGFYINIWEANVLQWAFIALKYTYAARWFGDIYVGNLYFPHGIFVEIAKTLGAWCRLNIAIADEDIFGYMVQVLKAGHFKMMVKSGNGKTIIAGADIAIIHNNICTACKVDAICIGRQQACPQPYTANMYRVAIGHVHTPERWLGDENILYSYPFAIAEHEHLIGAVLRYYRAIANAWFHMAEVFALAAVLGIGAVECLGFV